MLTEADAERKNQNSDAKHELVRLLTHELDAAEQRMRSAEQCISVARRYLADVVRLGMGL